MHGKLCFGMIFHIPMPHTLPSHGWASTTFPPNQPQCASSPHGQLCDVLAFFFFLLFFLGGGRGVSHSQLHIHLITTTRTPSLPQIDVHSHTTYPILDKSTTWLFLLVCSHHHFIPSLHMLVFFSLILCFLHFSPTVLLVPLPVKKNYCFQGFSEVHSIHNG
jgi:hypothetical protein